MFLFFKGLYFIFSAQLGEVLSQYADEEAEPQKHEKQRHMQTIHWQFRHLNARSAMLYVWAA